MSQQTAAHFAPDSLSPCVASEPMCAPSSPSLSWKLHCGFSTASGQNAKSRNADRFRREMANSLPSPGLGTRPRDSIDGSAQCGCAYVPYMPYYCANTTYQKLLHNATYVPYMVNYCANTMYQNFRFHTTQRRGASLRSPQLVTPDDGQKCNTLVGSLWGTKGSSKLDEVCIYGILDARFA